jgi:rubrerythrin
MSLKRPLSPESNNYLINNDTRQLKRLKLHSIIQQLRNEEAKLILLKKLRTSQHLSTRTNKISTPITNGFHPTATRIPTAPEKPAPLPITNIPLPQPSVPVTAARKTTNSPLLTNSNKPSSEERKNQAKLALRKQLERDLLGIPSPKPSLQDIRFIPNGISLEFPPLLGLEDVIQCLNELQNDRHRLPQRFTDHAHIDEPYICDQCGTDFTIRWWKDSNPIINILCDRCKTQVVRRTSKSEHSTLLKNVFLSAMKQEKEIEKNFHTLIKQEKHSSRSKSLTTNTPTPTYLPINNHQYQKTKNSFPQNFATKNSQQSTRKSNVILQS